MVYFYLRHQASLLREDRSRTDLPSIKALRIRRIGYLALAIIIIMSLFTLLPDRAANTLTIQALLFTGATDTQSMEQMRSLGDEAWQPVNPLKLRAILRHKPQLWFKIVVDPVAVETEFVAKVHFPLVSAVEFHLEKDGEIVDQASFGLEAMQSPSWREGVFPYYPFTVAPSSRTTLYVQTSGSGLTVFPLVVEKRNAYVQHFEQNIIMMALTLGCICGILLYNLSLFLVVRDRSFLFYAIFQGAVLAFMTFYNGVLPSMIKPIARHPATLPFIICLLLDGAILLFIRYFVQFLDLRRNYPFIFKMLMAYCLSVILAIIVLPMQSFYAGFLAQILLLGLVFPGVIGSLLLRIEQNHIFNLLMGYIGLAACTASYLLSLANIIPSNILADQMLYIGALWDAIFVSLAISDQLGAMRNERRQLLNAVSGQSEPTGEAPADASGRGLSARAMRVSIMFIDIANFSIMADRLGSVAVYRRLARQLGAIRAIIDSYKGSVDRSLGDGLLCFFANQNTDDSPSHVHNAFKAAIEIQRMTLESIKSSCKVDKTYMPVRIGLHVDQVLVGNLGSLGRVDFTMIGKGVNFANRFENACSPFKIVLSRQAREILGDSVENTGGFNEIHIAMGYQEELLMAYEYNPFFQEAMVLESVEKDAIRSLGITQRETRFRFLSTQTVKLVSPYGTFFVEDFSPNGFGVVGDIFIGRKPVLSVKIETVHQGCAMLLRRNYLETIQVEVRWCRERDQGFQHGMRIVGLNRGQKQLLYTLLSSAEKGHRESERLNSPRREKRPA